ncbi:MAG: GGDEF domain-containing protein [Ruminococcaceae bacterium]|nr:GGDEF domain-containing protein [Oscillospiraceae bacterium]
MPLVYVAVMINMPKIIDYVKEDVGRMALTYERKKQRQNNILYTIITAVLICAVFLGMVTSFYFEAEDEAYEMLHIQTKQIKDDLILQIKSDRENLVTMANFAAKLYADGESYNLMFESFKPIGLFSNIGILNPDNTFVTKMGSIDLNGKISFRDEASRGEYISGRVTDLTRDGQEIIRSAVPIKVNDKVVGILYGVIRLNTIGAKYKTMAKELDAQLFVYDKETGKFVIDTIDENPGELSQLKDRKYNDGYSYEALVNTDKGYTSFKSIFTGENLYVHYSTIEDFDWGIMLARYESQVFAQTHKISRNLLMAFAIMILIIVIYLQLVLKSEKDRTKLNAESSAIRKLLLERNERYTNITAAMKNIKEFSGSRSAFFVDSDGEDYFYIKPSLKEKLLSGEDRKYFQTELFRYAANIHNANKSSISFVRIIPNHHLAKTNRELYHFLQENEIKDVSFAIIADKNNHVSILGTINSKKSSVARKLIEDVAICFSIAIYNKKHLNKTELAATTDSLTGALNRVAYKKDILVFDEEKPEDFSCIYIDVNELHLRNNKYGHAAGDEMLIYIANTLKEVFFGHSTYRMGGDEFLVFTKNINQETVKQDIETFIDQLKPRGYHVAIGMSYRSQNTNCEEMVREAEIRMYEAKAQYYQNKEQNSVSEDKDKNYVYTKTGISEIDTMISVLKEHYNGIYRVSLENDNAHRILMPSYLGYKENEENFSKLLSKYIQDIVHPDFHRAVMSFLNYDAIKRQISEGKTPSITYKKIHGETVTLSIYNLTDDKDNVTDTLWVFAKE